MSKGYATSSGLKTADGAIYAGSCVLYGVQCGADNTNAGTVVLYDNASAASGDVVTKIVVDATTTNANFDSAQGIYCNKGIYLDIGGTGAEVVVFFAPA